MRLAFCVLFCAIEIYYQQCYGLNLIDLPAFGSDENSNEKEIGLKLEEFTSESPVLKEITGISSTFKPEKTNQEAQRRNYAAIKSSTFAPNTTSSSKTNNQSGVSLASQSKVTIRPYPPIRSTKSVKPSSSFGDSRRYWLVSAPPAKVESSTSNSYRDDKDENIKSKIGMLVQQTMHDTEIRMKTVQKLKDKHRDEPTYRVGFILSMIKKSRDVLNELFNVAVKHRDEWKALEQLKIFELIVHTNVDATNLVRQLVEIHIQNLNATAMANKENSTASRRTNLRFPDHDYHDDNNQVIR